MKNIVFHLTTEFHYLMALSLINKFYPEEEYKVLFIVVSNNKQKSRLRNIVRDKNFSFRNVVYNHNENYISKDVLDLKVFLENNKVYHFISFLYHDPLFVYLTFYFRAKGTTTFLAPDGMGAYVKFKNCNFRSRLINTLNAYRFLINHGLFLPKIWFTSWDFGENGYYDSIYALSKSLPYTNSKEIIKLKFEFSIEQINSLKRTFGVEFNNLPNLENIVLVISDRHYLPKYECELLQILANSLPDFKILYKRHPNQLGSLHYISENVFVINELFPVEILIASINNGIIISSYSNSMLYYNPKCRYFWTYPIVEMTGELKKPIQRFNPTDHINVLSSFDELENELKKIN